MADNDSNSGAVALVQTWGPIQWDGTCLGMQRVLDALTSAGAPREARISINDATYAVTKITATYIQPDSRMY